MHKAGPNCAPLTRPTETNLPIEAAGSQQLLKDINRMALVRHLCAQPGQSRADLATADDLVGFANR